MKNSLLKSELCRLGAVFVTVFLGLAGAFSQTPGLVMPGTNTAGYFDLSQGFSTAANPAGLWTFGWKESITSSSLTVITYGKSFTSDNGVPMFAWLEADDKQPSVSKVIGPGLAISAGGQFQALPGTIYVTAGEDDSPRNFVVVRFTVPASGTYLLLANVRDVFDGSFQGDTDFHITRNQVEFFSRALPPHATATVSNYLGLAAGDQIEFLVGRGEDGHREGSGLKLAATLTRIGSTPTPPVPPLPPGSFDLSANFSLTSNPAGPWSYGRLAALTGPFELLPNTRTFGAENGVPIGIWYREAIHKPWVAKVLGPGTAISYEFNSPAGTVYFGADPDSDPADFGAVRFTVPGGRGGIYRLMTTVRSLYDNARSTDADFHVLRNGQELFSELVPANSGSTYSNVLILAAGDRIDFAAGRGSGDPNTGLKIQATLTPFFSGTNVPPPPPPVPVNAFDLSRDFSLASNPNGAWRYGYLTELGGSFGLLQAPRTFSADNGVPISVWELSLYQLPIVAKVMGPDTAHSDGTHFTAAPGTIYFAPGADNAPQNFGVIRFVVPPDKAGQYRLETSVQSLFDFDRSRDADFHVLKNGDELFGQFLTPNSGTSYSNTIFLAAGDTIDFAIGRGADGTTYDTGLKIQATLTPLTINPPPPPPTQSFDLSADFSLAANPNGVWRYGYLTELGGAFGLLGAPRTFGADNGVPIAVWELSLYHLPTVAKVMGPETAHSDGNHFTAAPGTIYFAPGADNAPENYGAIRFVVPPDKAGHYRLETSVQSLFDFDRSRDADFRVLKNGQELFGQALPPNSGTSYSNTLVLAAGDAIDFAIGRGPDGTTYDTGLKIQATLTPLTNSPPPPPPPQSFDLSTDFSLAANPNGVWRYGYLTELGGTFGLLGAPRTFGADNGVPISVWELSLFHLPIVAKVMGPETAHSDGNHFTAAPGTIYFAPGADNAPENYGAIRFVVPPDRAGQYRLVTSVRSLFDFDRSRDADFHVLKNGDELFGQFLPPNSGTAYSNTLFLAAGDTVDFAIGRGADGTTYDTGLKIQATLTPLTIHPPMPPGTNCIPAPNGLAAFWSFEDAASTGLQLTGNPVFAEGKVGRSLQFDGVNDQAFSPAAAGLDVGTADGFSIETWVNPSNVTMQPIAEWTIGPSSGVHFWIGVYGSGSIFANLVDIHQQSHSWRSDTDIVVPNEWQHVAMSYEKSSGLLRFYLNGQKVTEHSVGPISPQTSYPLAIGYRPDQEHFAGRIDELAIYRRALSDAEFAAIHAAGSRGKCPIPGAPGPGRPAFDLARDYSTNTNPSGVWSYGWKSTLDGTFNLFGYHGFSFEGGTLIDYWLKSDHGPSSVYHNSGPATLVNNDGAGTYPPGTVWFGPGYDENPDNFSVIRFTVPAGAQATYRLATEVRPALDGPIAGDTDFHVLKNGTELFGRNLPANAGTNFAALVPLAPGDTIDFVCGRGADGQAYASALKIQAMLTPFTNSVPPPTPQPNCVTAPGHLVAWWPAEQNPNDVSGTHHATLLDRTTYAAGRVGSAFAFRGGESGARIPASRDLNVGAGPGLTIEGWINPADLSIRSPLVEWNRGGSNIVEWGLHIFILRPDEFELGAGNLYANLTDASGQSHFVMAPGGTVSANTWQHIALTYDRETGMGRLYCNGAMVAESELGNFTPATTYDLYLGRRPAGDDVRSFNGLLDEISIYSRALTAGEIAAVARAGSAGKCRLPASLDELVRLVHTIPAPANPQSLLDGLEAVRASILRGNFLSALQQLADFQNNARSLLGAVNPSLSAQIISLAQFVIETLDPTGARRSELLGIRNIPMRVLRVQAIEQPEGIWWIQGCARPGSVCCVQRSLNLQDWEHAGFATEVDDGIFEWIDVTPGPAPRFYRLLEP